VEEIGEIDPVTSPADAADGVLQQTPILLLLRMTIDDSSITAAAAGTAIIRTGTIFFLY